MRVAGSKGSSPFDQSNSVGMAAELGEPVTSPYIHAPVTPYSVPVAGGWAYVCGTGHTHVTYEAAERCGRPVAVSYDPGTDHDDLGPYVDSSALSADNGIVRTAQCYCTHVAGNHINGTGLCLVKSCKLCLI